MQKHFVGVYLYYTQALTLRSLSEPYTLRLMKLAKPIQNLKLKITTL